MDGLISRRMERSLLRSSANLSRQINSGDISSSIRFKGSRDSLPPPFMAALPNERDGFCREPDKPTGSVCMSCFATVRALRPEWSARGKYPPSRMPE